MLFAVLYQIIQHYYVMVSVYHLWIYSPDHFMSIIFVTSCCFFFCFCGCVPQTAWTGPAVAPALDAAATPGCRDTRDMACGPDEPYREPRPGFFEPRDILAVRWLGPRTPAMLDVACQTKESFFDRSVRFLSRYDVRFTEKYQASFKRRREDLKRRSFMDKHGQCDL